MRVLLTGGAGYIGSFVADQLSSRGHLVAALDNFSNGRHVSESIDCFAQIDLRNRQAVSSFVRDVRPDGVIHLAALKSVSESMASPGLYFDHNVSGTLNLMAALEGGGTLPILFSSSAAVYGAPPACPITEDMPLRPASPYGESKVAAERIVARHATLNGSPYACLRYFNVGGAKRDGTLGEMPARESTQLIPACLRAAMSGRPMTVFGQNLGFATRDGSAVRDYVHVEDVAEAHVRVLEGLVGGGPSGAFNVGHGHGVTVLEIVELCRKVSGSDFGLIHEPARAGDIAVSLASTDLIRRAFGFRARRTLEELIRSEWAWAGRTGQARCGPAPSHDLRP
jgi:UDP-glucose-4-epimerase GalE